MKTLLPSRARHAFPASLLLLLLAALLPPARAAAPPARGVRVEGVEPVGRPNAGNAALFVGVNEFEDTSLRALRFAVNDSVAQAHLFVLDLKLIPPGNTVLLLSGEPGTPATRTQLAALKDAGVRVEKASRSRLFNELARAVAVPQETADLVIVSLSSHGFEENGVPYVLPADGTRGFLADTGFSLKTVEDRLGRSKAGKRLLIVDACREKATGDDKSTGGAMDPAWRAALAQASGQAVLASCDVGQFSFEDVKLGHGVFTYHLLEALGGKAAADPRGFITLGAVSDHVARAVNEWVGRNKVGSVAESAQKPWFKGPNDARDMPLAVSRAMLGMQRELAARKIGAQERLADAYKAQNKLLTARLLDEVERGLEAMAGEKLEELLEQIGELATPTPVRVRGFVGWWDGRGRRLAGLVPDPVVPPVPPPTPVPPAPVVVALEGAGQRRSVSLPGEVKLELEPIPAGKFQMGSPAGEEGRYPDEGPQREVEITRSFWLGRHEVTQGQWEALMGRGLKEQANFHEAGAGDTKIGIEAKEYPMYWVSWTAAVEFCRKLTERERGFGRVPAGYEYRLPTEAEWEYAARAGTTTALYTGAMKILGTNNAPALDPIAWYAGNSSEGYTGKGWSMKEIKERQYSGDIAGPRPVGQKKANAFGLYDMLGNVWEWCADVYDKDYPSGSQKDPYVSVSSSGSDRVVRGGGWFYRAASCRAAVRIWIAPGFAFLRPGLPRRPGPPVQMRAGRREASGAS